MTRRSWIEGFRPFLDELYGRPMRIDIEVRIDSDTVWFYIRDNGLRFVVNREDLGLAVYGQDGYYLAYLRAVDRFHQAREAMGWVD